MRINLLRIKGIRIGTCLGMFSIGVLLLVLSHVVVVTKTIFYVKARYTLDFFARDIAIKRYCDKEIKRHFSFNIFFPVCIDINFSSLCD
jgi:hypothetical protein